MYCVCVPGQDEGRRLLFHCPSVFSAVHMLSLPARNSVFSFNNSSCDVYSVGPVPHIVQFRVVVEGVSAVRCLPIDVTGVEHSLGVSA